MHTTPCHNTARSSTSEATDIGLCQSRLQVRCNCGLLRLTVLKREPQGVIKRKIKVANNNGVKGLGEIHLETLKRMILAVQHSASEMLLLIYVFFNPQTE